MKRLKLITGLVVAFVLVSGCATVKVYSDTGLNNETGLRYYTLKPYLLVEYLANKDNTVKTSVVYLPDLSSPQYIKIRSGLGAGELKMSFANSALESYGVAIDSKLPESFEAFAAMLSKSAYAAQAFEGGPPYTSPTDGETPPDSGRTFRLYEIHTGPSGTTLKEVMMSKDKIQGL